MIQIKVRNPKWLPFPLFLNTLPDQVVQMIINMYHGGPDACGSFTTGGTELGHPTLVALGELL